MVWFAPDSIRNDILTCYVICVPDIFGRIDKINWDFAKSVNIMSSGQAFAEMGLQEGLLSAGLFW